MRPKTSGRQERRKVSGNWNRFSTSSASAQSQNA